jgi:hypothetical protein
MGVRQTPAVKATSTSFGPLGESLAPRCAAGNNLSHELRTWIWWKCYCGPLQLGHPGLGAVGSGEGSRGDRFFYGIGCVVVHQLWHSGVAHPLVGVCECGSVEALAR